MSDGRLAAGSDRPPGLSLSRMHRPGGLSLQRLARDAGLELAGVAAADILARVPDVPFFHSWVDAGHHGGLPYLTGERASIRGELERLLPGVRSVICLALNYNTALPYSVDLPDPTRAWIARYAWGDDYHSVMRARLLQFVEALRTSRSEPFAARVCVDTSPVLERALARHTSVGWLGKNTCVINERLGSWLFLGEVLTTLELASDAPAPDRCGSCTRCLEACPTGALLEPRVLDSRLCISYWTIEARGAIPPDMRPGLGRHVFGCDICQDVCPWNSTHRVSTTADPVFQPRGGLFDPPLAELACLDEDQFNAMFRNSPVRRPKYSGFMRNVCVAMGNSGDPKFLPSLEPLAAHSDPLIREHAQWALDQIRSKV